VVVYKLLIRQSAAKELEALPLKERRRIAKRIEALAANPRPPGSERMAGEKKYRLRQGDYRILYSVEDSEVSVIVVRIAHRREAYRV
jgi:mRNA interferase RelE/StbE